MRYASNVARKSGAAALPAIAPPKPGDKTATSWEGKIAEAVQAREDAKNARRGKRIGFSNAFTRR